jgi:glycosyltransferase involved in cell wall biosynthesis
MDQVCIVAPGRVAIIGNSQPRQCGIATFTNDLATALASVYPEVAWPIVAMNDTPEGYAYPPNVRFTIDQDDPASYLRAATALNRSGVELVLLQHEYGIFGGSAGDYLLPLLRRLRMPVVTTLHTILGEPNFEQRRVLAEIAQISARVITMSHLGVERLQKIYGVSAEKIVYIPHGIPDVPFTEPADHKDRFGLTGRPLMLTFGLLSPGKGIETVIKALPAIVARYPDFVYLVVGATHPHIKEHHGEAYREGLVQLAQELGVAHNLILHDHFVKLDELVRYIAAADLYITPYLGREQIVSGTLAYTLGAGKAIISTPYPYAEELLADGRGELVAYGDSVAIAERTLRLLDHPAERRELRERAYQFGRWMVWPNVAHSYMGLFQQVLTERTLLRQTVLLPLSAELPLEQFVAS